MLGGAGRMSLYLYVKLSLLNGPLSGEVNTLQCLFVSREPLKPAAGKSVRGVLTERKELCR